MTNSDKLPPEPKVEHKAEEKSESKNSESSIWAFLWKEHAELIVLTVSHVIFACIVQYYWMEQNIFSINLLDDIIYHIYLFFLFVGLIYLQFVSIIRPLPKKRLLLTFWIRLRSVFLNFKSLACVIVMFAIFKIMGTMFIGIKYSIPYIQPFAWDQTFDEMDRVLHFGTRPWEWLQPIMTPLISFVLCVLYQAWFFVVAFFFFWMTLSKRYKLRKQFFITYIIAWIFMGGLGAIIFSSAGPCYYGFIYPDMENPYADLMQYLNAAHNNPYEMYVLNVQEWLWTSYEEKNVTFMAGISAFPSMHIAMCVLGALTAWRVHRYFGIGMAVYAFLIFIGSVHSGWHYAVDGYASAIMIFIIWYLAGRWIQFRGGYEEDEKPQEDFTESKSEVPRETA